MDHWVKHLDEVGAPFLRRVDQVAGARAQAARLEREAAAAREYAARLDRDLEKDIRSSGLWTAAEIRDAKGRHGSTHTEPTTAT